MRTLIAPLFAALMAGAPASASLLVDITGREGSGVTTWVFSGSTFATGSGSFSADTGFLDAEQFKDVGDFTLLQVFDVPQDGGSIEGDATLSVNWDTRGIDSVFIDDDSAAGGDDIAFGVTGSRNLAFEAGDLVSWTGTLSVFGIDIGDLSAGGLPNTLRGVGLGGSENLALEVTISPVPLPAGLLLMLSGLGAALGLRARRKAA